MKRILHALAVCLVAGVPALSAPPGKTECLDIGKELAESADNWEQTAEDYAIEHNKSGFAFAEGRKRDTVVCRRPGAVVFFGFPVMETRVYFKDRRMSGVELSLYNKGDAVAHGGAMTEDALDELVGAVSARLSGEGGKMPQTKRVRVKNDREKMGYRLSRSWPDRTPAAELVWGLSGEKKSKVVEYLRLSLKNAPPRNIASKYAKPASRAGAGGYAANVKKNDEGDLYIANVPMVNQGDKGYCSAASAERVLRYFGQEIDEHEIAQIAGTSAQNGTSTKAMISAVETIGKKCRLSKREIASKLGNWDDSEKRMKEYNRAAKRMKKPELSMDDYITVRGNTRILDVGKMEHAMDAKVLKAMSMKDSQGYAKFIKGIREQTARGVPLFWSVRLGIYPEPEIPQASGGHMRLIIGYNEEKGEVIYSDSWGAGHERKHMPDDWAWTITHNLFYLNPR